MARAGLGNMHAPFPTLVQNMHSNSEKPDFTYL